MVISLQQLCLMFPHTGQQQLAQYVDPLNEVCDRFQINQPYRVRAFLSQLGVECAAFTHFEENLNYSAKGLTATFPKHFPPVVANSYARKPEAIANRAYANRLGNGDEASGDGWKFRGRGGIQITGKSNYQLFATYMGMTLDQVVAYLGTPEGQMMVSGWYWDANGLNRWADAQDMLTITRKINGGTNGLAERMAYWNQSKVIFTSTGQSIGGWKTVQAQLLNVRQGPSTAAAIVKQLPQGTKVLVVSTTGDWSQIQPSGFVSSAWIA